MFYVSPLTKVTFLLKKVLSFGARGCIVFLKCQFSPASVKKKEDISVSNSAEWHQFAYC